MNPIAFRKTGLVLVAAVSVGIWVLLVWQHFHGGVPSHSFMARKDMPSISNWWGALLLPLLTSFTLNRLKKRLFLTHSNTVASPKQLQTVALLFVA